MRTPSGSVRINGAVNSSANFTVDGITNLDTGSNGTSHFEPNMDSIAEMRVLTSNYQAEYGRNSGGVISVVTKGGSQRVPRQRVGQQAPRDVQRQELLPELQRPAEERLPLLRLGLLGWRTGLHSQALQYRESRSSSSSGRRNTPSRSRPRRAATPTCRPSAQRAGDFSGYTDANGVPVALTDPTTGNPVPGNNITALVALNPGRGQGRPGHPERPAVTQYLRPLRRLLHRLHCGRSVRHPAVPAQLLLELQ